MVRPASAPPVSGPGLRGFMALAGLFLLAALVVRPVGNFPLNDEWIYYCSVSQRLATGTDLIDRATNTYLYPQRYYGTALARLFGFSFSMLRLSGLAASLLALLLAYRLLGRLGFSPFACFAGAATLLVNPVYLNLSYSFMTDVPYLMFFLGSLLFYVRAAQRGSRTDLTAGACLTILALAQRQTGVLLSPAALAYFFLSRKRLRPTALDWGILVLPVAAFAVLAAFRYLGTTAEMSAAALLDPRQWARLYRLRPMSDQLGTNPGWMADFYAIVLVALPASLGFFLLPLLVGGLFRIRKAIEILPRAFAPAAFLSLAALIGLRAAVFGVTLGEKLQVRDMPFLKNILNRCGLGPGAGEVLVGTCKPVLGASFWNALTPLALAAGAVLLGLVLPWAFSRLRAIRWRDLSFERSGPEGGEGIPAGEGIVVLAGATQVVLFFIVYPLDRYLMPLIIPAALIVLDAFRSMRLSRAAVALALLPFLLYGVAGMHDYLAWNRVRWDLGRTLVAQGVPMTKIDGGLEWAGYNLYFKNPWGARGPKPPGLLWYVYHVPNLDPEYLISFSEIPGYRPIGSRSVPTWLPGPETRLIVSRRVPR
jgi:hypothetical protein